MNRTIAIVIAKTVFGAGLALGFATMPHAIAHETTFASLKPAPGYNAYAHEESDGRTDEDDPQWSCVDDGNKICGADNPQGVPAGRYDEGGVLVDPWPLDR